MKKFITLMVAAALTTAANAQSVTETFGSAQISGLEKDTDVPCAGFTVPGTYFASGTSKVDVYDGDKGMKLRANKGSDGNELMLLVNEDCTITDLSMGMVVNDASSTFSLAAISIDGSPVADFTSVALPNTKDAAGAAVVNLKGIKAKENIVFTYDFEGYEGKNKQVFIAGSVTYEEGAASAVFEWSPVSLNPMAVMDVNSLYAAANVNFQVYEVDGVAPTEVMPVWIDEDGNEIKAVSGAQDDWNTNQFFYEFNTADFKANGEYILRFPEGMLVNAAGEKSAKIETPYTFDIAELAPAMFDDFKILSITPDLNKPQAIWTDQKITIDTNHNDAIGLTTLQIIDMTMDESVTFSSSFSTGRALGDKSPVSWEVVGSFKFFEGHDYKAEFTFYNGQDEVDPDGVPTKIVDRVSYEFTGRVEGFKYSSVELLSVEPVPLPDPMSVVISSPEQAVFTYTFSGPVNVYKAATPLGQNGLNEYPATSLSSNEDKTVWTLDLSDDSYVKTVESVLTIYIYARDLDGNQLKGEWGEENESCFVREWHCDLGGFPIVVASPADGAKIESLSEILVKSESGSPMSWSWMGEVSVRNEYDQELGTLVYQAPDGVDDTALTEFHFSKMMDDSWNVVDLSDLPEGFYSLYFAPGCFYMGDQFESKPSRSLTSSFSISGGSVADPQETLKYASVSPESDSTVKSLDTVILSFSEPVTCDDFEVNVYSTGRALVTTGVARTDFMEPTVIVVSFNDPVAEAGRYEVVIPARKIVNGDFFESEGQSGLCNPEYHLYYTVDDSEGPGIDPSDQEVFGYTEVSPADGSVVKELGRISLWFPDVVMTLDNTAYIYKADATGSDPVTTAFVNWSMEDDFLITVDPATPVSEAGEYVVVIPARTICDDAFFGSEGKSGICNPEIKLAYTVDPEGGSSVDVVSSAADADVFDLQGRLVLHNATSADLKTLSKGIYVVGGRKLVVK
ncbi:MAG: T9SS type A sorting domain-containing protein [Muribaculaceae bacterium]|nr:T9SS type A sorting domain-containing protein [Muribaculaceae bacterium]